MLDRTSLRALPNAQPSEEQKRALESGRVLCQYDTSEIVIRYLNDFCEGGGLYPAWTANEPRPSLAACNYTDSAQNAFRAAGRNGGLVRADLRLTDLRYMPLNSLDFTHADLSRSMLNNAEMANARLYGVNISGADLTGIQKLGYAYGTGTMFYYRGEEPSGLIQACRGLDIDNRPMALTKKDYEALCRLQKKPENSDEFSKKLQILRRICDQKLQNTK